MSRILTEITGLASKDCFYIVERHKTKFTYPIHKHREFELNFIQHGAGVRRIVGDSIEEIGEYDLVLVAGENLEHAWEQGQCESSDIREITIQFSPELFDENLLSKNQFLSIRKMLADARHGIAFPLDAILKIYRTIDTLAMQQDGFVQFLNFLMIMYELSQCSYRVLSSGAFANADAGTQSSRITQIKEYIDAHITEELTLTGLAGMAGMSPSAFSRFFKLHTNRTLTNYISDARLGYAARELIDTSRNISEICYNCGFNNLSNFNRIFKSLRGVTPKQFRQLYKKNKINV